MAASSSPSVSTRSSRPAGARASWLPPHALGLHLGNFDWSAYSVVRPSVAAGAARARRGL